MLVGISLLLSLSLNAIPAFALTSDGTRRQKKDDVVVSGGETSSLGSPMPRNADASLPDDIEFIFSEIVRLKGLLNSSGFKAIPKRDVFFDLSGPNDRKIMCGEAAFRRLEELSAKAAQRAGLQKRVKTSTIRKQLGRIIFERFVTENREINLREIYRSLSAAAKIAKNDCIDRTFLLPVYFVRPSDPSEIILGPVRIYNREQFRKRIAPLVKRYRAEMNPSEPWRGRHILMSTLKYYRGFQWFAEVEIKGCDPDTAASLAQDAVVSAFNCLHLILSARNSSNIGIGELPSGVDRRGRLALDGGSKLYVSASVSWIGTGAPYADGWSNALKSEAYQDLILLCGLALEGSVDPDLERPVSQRFLDAAHWFGEGVREKSPAAQVVKYVTALERMLMTDEKGDITGTLSKRASSLRIRFEPEQSLSKLEADYRRAYSLRSKLVHGSISPNAPEVRANVNLVARMVEMAILAALVALDEPALLASKVSSKRLGRWYNNVVQQAESVE